MAIVYQHLKKDSGEIFNIGIGKNKQRAYSKDGRNMHWKNIVNKHGYDVEILIEDITWELATEYEIILIEFYGRSDKNAGPLANRTSGGEGKLNCVFSKESIKKISDKLKNRRLSEETKLRISKSTKGVPKPKGSFVGKKKHSEESKNKMRKPKEKVECPHCKKIGGIPVMKRYHFNNCASLNN